MWYISLYFEFMTKKLSLHLTLIDIKYFTIYRVRLLQTLHIYRRNTVVRREVSRE